MKWSVGGLAVVVYATWKPAGSAGEQYTLADCCALVDWFPKKEIFQNKIKSIPLNVSAPFHCSLMKSAADNMKEKINKTTFQKPKIEIIHNVTTKSENDVNKIKNLLIEQIYSSVRWRESIINMFDAGVLNFIEIGPGKALTGMIKRTLKNVNCFSINEITDIKNLNNEFRK